jgi:hypothetical protein
MTNNHSRHFRKHVSNPPTSTKHAQVFAGSKVRAFRMQEEFGPKKFIKP